jgi:outer membrane lipoprotein-sorting protein
VTLRLLIASLTLLLAASCAPLRPDIVGEALDDSLTRALLRPWSDEGERVETIKGLAELSVKAPLTDMRGRQVLLAQSPDQVRAETLNPFGLPLLQMIADGSRLGVLLPSRGSYYIGSATAENLETFAHVRLQLTDLVGVLLYRPPLLEAWKEQTFVLRQGGWLVKRYASSARQELTFNPSRQLIGAALYEENELLMKVTYSDFATETAVVFPRKLVLELAETRTTIRLTFTELAVNQALRPELFSLSPPPGVHVVYLPD